MIIVDNKQEIDNQIIIYNTTQKESLDFLDKEEQQLVQSKLNNDVYIVNIQIHQKHYTIYGFKPEENANDTKEKLRIDAHKIHQQLFVSKEKKVLINVLNKIEIKYIKAFVEGFLLSQYTFDKYKRDKTEKIAVYINNNILPKEIINEINATVDAVNVTKNLINEPQNLLNTTQYQLEIKKICQNTNIKHTYWNQTRIEKEKMGGLLAVNRGSEYPAYFHILEYKPTNHKNTKPLVFVGKGVMYDTGGLSIKPTPNSMDLMKCDMAGSATIIGAMLAISKLKLPYHIVGLLPTVENKINEKSICPGDIITMYDGTTVEVMNTDAEGRLILADALHYAKKLNPELVIDLATLTGASIRAIGKEAAAIMSNADKKLNKKIEKAGFKTAEKLIFFPLWKEYKEQLKSDIADLKNLGGTNAGNITAAKFLEHFTNYPWIHIDLSPAYVTSNYNYRGKYATAFGVRLLCKFVKNLTKEKEIKVIQKNNTPKNVKPQARKNKSRNNNR
jgi:leucyl aminopeptidase